MSDINENYIIYIFYTKKLVSYKKVSNEPSKQKIK